MGIWDIVDGVIDLVGFVLVVLVVVVLLWPFMVLAHVEERRGEEFDGLLFSFLIFTAYTAEFSLIQSIFFSVSS